MNDPPTDPIAAARRSYAEELRLTAHVRSPAVIAAFATVPRERFVGPGPWHVLSPMGPAEHWMAANADPVTVYHDVLIALDEARRINNGQPSLWAYLLDQLPILGGERVTHLGCGTGYYTAIIAELVGPTGAVKAIEMHADLAAKARILFKSWPHVTVVNVDAASVSIEPSDLIVASAGATHPLPAWLDALKPAGRSVPIDRHKRMGGMLLLESTGTRVNFAAKFLCSVGFIDFEGVRNPDISRRLARALTRDQGRAVQSLRRDLHPKGRTCWLHEEGWCLSRRLHASSRAAAAVATTRCEARLGIARSSVYPRSDRVLCVPVGGSGLAR